MRQSYLRKVSLQPLNSSHFKSKKSIVDYQQYQEQLSNFNKTNKIPDLSQMFDWSKPNEVFQMKQRSISLPQQNEINRSQLSRISQPQQRQQSIPNNSMNTEQLLRSQEGQDVLLGSEDDSIDVQSPRLMVEKVGRQFGSEYKLMSQIKLQNELRSMRQRIIEMNIRLNSMLDKYQLLGVRYIKRDVQVSDPYNFLGRQIEVNNKIILKQQKHIKQLQQKDRQLEGRDYLVEITDLIVAVKKQIHSKEKEKHTQLVDVQKMNKTLKEIEKTQDQGDQFKQIKELKHQIVFYHKKLKELENTQDQLDKDWDILIEKQKQMTSVFVNKMEIAMKKHLEVSSNRTYVERKKKYDQLINTVENHRKKREVVVRNFKMITEKLESQNQHLKKLIQKKDMETQEVQYQSIGFDEDSKEVITKNNIVNRELRAISYRFDGSLIRKDKNKLKPDFKRVLSRMEGKVNQTIDASSPINDKNSPLPILVTSSEENAESSAMSRMKPILRSWKGKQVDRYQGSIDRHRTLQNSSIFKPGPLIRAKK